MRPHAVVAPLVAAVLAAQTPEGKAKDVPLKHELLDAPSVVPLVLRIPVRGDRLPEAVGRAVSVRASPKQLEVDLDDSGRFATKVSPKKGAIVAIAPDPREGAAGAEAGAGGARNWLLAGDASGFWIAPASLLVGTFAKMRLELLDADHDGRFDSAKDWARLGSAPFHRLAAETPWVGSGESIFSLTVASGPRGATAALDALRRDPAHSEAQWTALAAANTFRLANGLGPMRLDAALCDGCQKHALYLQLNQYDYGKPWDGVGSHDEDPSKPGYSEQGRNAARACSTAGSPDAADSIRSQTETMLHRTSYLGPAGCGLGVGSVAGGTGSARGYSVVGGPKPDGRSLGEVVAVPAPSSAGVPTRIASERPPVERDPKFYDVARGYPISVSFGRVKCVDPRLRLFDARGKEVPGSLFTPSSPIHSTRPENANTAFFVADGPLDGGARYEAEFTCSHAGAPVHWRWTFTTR